MISFGIAVNESPKTRNSLILRLKQPADAEAWFQFCEIYEPLILRIAKARGLQAADASDLAQDVFIRIAKSVGRWESDPDKGSFRGWIGTIARNLTIDFLRRQSRQPVSTNDPTLQNVAEQCAESDFYDAEYEKQLFAWAAEKIKPTFQANTWNAFWQTAVEQQAVSDVAASLNISPGAVYMARSRVIARLRKTIEQFTASEDSACLLYTSPSPRDS